MCCLTCIISNTGVSLSLFICAVVFNILSILWHFRCAFVIQWNMFIYWFVHAWGMMFLPPGIKFERALLFCQVKSNLFGIWANKMAWLFYERAVLWDIFHFGLMCSRLWRCPLWNLILLYYIFASNQFQLLLRHGY